MYLLLLLLPLRYSVKWEQQNMRSLHYYFGAYYHFSSGFAKIHYPNPWISNWWCFKLIISLLRSQVSFYLTNALITWLCIVTVINIIISTLMLCAVFPLKPKKRTGGKWALTKKLWFWQHYSRIFFDTFLSSWGTDDHKNTFY